MITPRSASSPLTLAGGPLRRYWQAQTDPLGLFEEIAATGEEVVRLPFGPLGTYVAVHGQAAREMLVVRPDDFPKETRGQRLLRALLGTSVLTAQGAAWKARRRVVQPAFTKDHYARYARQMATLTSEAVGRWGAQVDLRHELMRLTLKVACVTLFSDGLDDEADRVDHALTAALDAYRVLLAVPALRPDSRLPVGPPARWRAARRDLSDVVSGLLTRRERSGRAHDDLLGRLLASGLGHDDLVSEVVTMLLAGHETTANGLCWGLWELSRRPQLQRLVQAEAAAAPDDDGPRGVLAAATWRGRPLTEGVWRETLRLHPPVWMMARAVARDTTLAGVPVPSGTTAFACLHVLHRSAPWRDPEAFDPWRWTRPDAPQGLYLPFGVGKRKCLGERFASMEAAIVLGEVMRRVHLSPTPGPDPQPQLSVTLRPRDAVQVRVRPLAR